MNIYNYLFINYYELALYMIVEANNPDFRTPSEGSCYIITILEACNVITLWLFLGLKSLTGVIYVDIFLCIAIFYGLNYIVFLKNKKYKKVFDKIKNDSEIKKSMGFWTSFFYPIVTIFLLFYVIWNKY